MNIGIDFDGVIADAIKLKQRLFRQELGIRVKPEECSADKLEARVSKQDYVRIVEGMIYATELCLGMDEVAGAREIVARLRKDGHKVYVITSRYDNQAEYAKRWLAMRQIPYDKMINTGDEPKSKVCRENNIAVLVEDSPKKLYKARNRNMRMILLTRPYNADAELKPGMGRARDWKEVYGLLAGARA